MKAKTGPLRSIELPILETAIELRVRGARYFHGFMMAREIKERQDARLLTAHGTLYKALDRLRRLGFLESEWEDPLLAAQEGRPRRRFYSLTAAGEAALVQTPKAAQQTAPVTALRERPPGMASV